MKLDPRFSLNTPSDAMILKPVPSEKNIDVNTCREKANKDSLTESSNNQPKRRKRKNRGLKLGKNIDKLVDLIYSGKLIKIEAYEFNCKEFSENSRNQSRYFGVARNGHNWQVIFNRKSIRKYIGTYSTENEAAIVHDFYSIAFYFDSAKTNFSYSANTILKMVEAYDVENDYFDSLPFLNIAG